MVIHERTALTPRGAPSELVDFAAGQFTATVVDAVPLDDFTSIQVGGEDPDFVPLPTTYVEANPSNLASLINSNPGGTSFLLASGTYNGTFPNKAGNRYYGETVADLNTQPTVIFNGNTTYSDPSQPNSGNSATGGSFEAFVCQSNNWFVNLAFVRYRGAGDEPGNGALTGSGADDVRIAQCWGWENQMSTFRFDGNRWLVTNVRVFHNGKYAFAGSGTDHVCRGFLIYENAVPDPAWGVPAWHNDDAGGSKIVFSTNFTFEDGESWGHPVMGLWYDIANVNSVARNIYVHDNGRHGIIFEASHGPGLIENCVAEDNATKVQEIPYRDAQIFVAMFPDVEVRNNVVGSPAGRAGITAYQWNHPQYGNGNAGRVENLYVHDNVFNQVGESVAGIANLDDLGQSAHSPAANNRFVNNTYNDTDEFYWGGFSGGEITYAEWQALGMS